MHKNELQSSPAVAGEKLVEVVLYDATSPTVDNRPMSLSLASTQQVSYSALQLRTKRIRYLYW